ncbi:MAG: Type 1 glutamine amidotransferase-like domain-containing protein [Chloroflexi bacterium]|nr:Type 1 glutamine amidotransferase-like domain-containing protein [Chloroflexota bacterium]
MTKGYLVVNGGEAFTIENRPANRAWLRLVHEQHSPRVIVVPVAAMRKQQRVASEISKYFEFMGMFAEYKMIVDQLSANTRTEWESLDKVEAIVLTDGSPLDLIERLRGTHTEAALHRALERKAVVMTTGASALAAGSVFWFADQWETGLTLVPNLAFLPHHDLVQMRLSPERLLANLPEGITLVGVDASATLIYYPDGTGQVAGEGLVTVYRSVEQQDEFRPGQTFPLTTPGAE